MGFYIDEKGFRWGQEVDTDAEGLLTAEQDGHAKERKGQLEAAKSFLEEALSSGPMWLAIASGQGSTGRYIQRYPLAGKVKS